MKIAFGCDHRGYILKDAILAHLRENGHEVVDMGTDSTERVDYPVYGEKVGRAVASGECALGIVVCGTGFGISLAAGNVKGVRAICCSDIYTARLTREHNNANVLALGAGIVGPNLALEIVETFLTTPFLGGRHQRRVDKFMALEQD